MRACFLSVCVCEVLGRTRCWFHWSNNMLPSWRLSILSSLYQARLMCLQPKEPAAGYIRTDASYGNNMQIAPQPLDPPPARPPFRLHLPIWPCSTPQCEPSQCLPPRLLLLPSPPLFYIDAQPLYFFLFEKLTKKGNFDYYFFLR